MCKNKLRSKSINRQIIALNRPLLLQLMIIGNKWCEIEWHIRKSGDGRKNVAFSLWKSHSLAQQSRINTITSTIQPIKWSKYIQTFTFVVNCSNKWKKISLWISYYSKTIKSILLFWVHNCIVALTLYFMHRQSERRRQRQAS